MKVLDKIEQSQMKKDLPAFRAGDTLRVHVKIKEGDKLLVQVTDRGILFKPIRKLEDCAGIDSKHGKVKEINKEIDKLREEY